MDGLQEPIVLKLVTMQANGFCKLRGQDPAGELISVHCSKVTKCHRPCADSRTLERVRAYMKNHPTSPTATEDMVFYDVETTIPAGKGGR